jgi:hypothetical protein
MSSCPVGAESESVPAKRKTKPKQATKLSLYPAKFEDVVKAFLQTPPPPSSKKAKK